MDLKYQVYPSKALIAQKKILINLMKFFIRKQNLINLAITHIVQLEDMMSLKLVLKETEMHLHLWALV